MCVFKIEYLEDGVCSLAVLTLYDGVCDAHLLGSHVVFKNCLAVQADPCIFGAGNGDLNLGVSLYVLVYVLLVVGAEPELAVHFACEHEGAALCLAVAANGGQILYGICVQKLDNLFHDKYLQNDYSKLFSYRKLVFFFRWHYTNAVELICEVSTILCRSYLKDTNDRLPNGNHCAAARLCGLLT